jgi:hypothetical protein
LELWKHLQLDRFFEDTLDQYGADVPWSPIASVLAINRLCAPGSEFAIEQRRYPSTALDDLLAISEGKLNDTRLYRCLDQILPHKAKIEKHLKQRYGELFSAEFDVLRARIWRASAEFEPPNRLDVVVSSPSFTVGRLNGAGCGGN